MSKKKILTIAMCVAMAAILAVGTLAYFTDETEEFTNTFTMGNVDIELTETSTEEDGVPGVETDDGYKYENIVPGVNYAKNAKVTVEDDSEDCYVFVELTLTNAENVRKECDYTSYDALISGCAVGFDPTVWRVMNNPAVGTDGNVKYILGYIADKGNDGKICVAEDEIPVFSAIKLPESVDDAVNFNITIKAAAIQADGIEKGETQGMIYAAYNALYGA